MPDDTLTLTLRLHDPLEKKDPEKSTAWAVVPVVRADLALPLDEFFAKYVRPAFIDPSAIARFLELQKH